MNGVIKFLKDWMLVFAMILGASIYLIYKELDILHPYSGTLLAICKTVQPILLFCMLFLSFCRVKPSDLKPRGWMGWLLLIQGAMFVLPTLAVFMLGGFSGALSEWRISVEAFTLCMICPTATACSVLTAKLGGSRAGAMTYTIFINLLVAVIVPLMVPLVHPVGDLDFWNAFLLILAKVFPMLILPCFLAWIVRYCMPKFHKLLVEYTELAFYIWAVSLTLAILMSTRAIVHSAAGIAALGGIALASLISCAIQFWIGKAIGARYNDKITAGQSMGQKNTVFAIWLGYTFLDPLSSVAGGFYSIWHNVYNSWQLYKQRKSAEKM